MKKPLLEIKNLRTFFKTQNAVLKAVNDVTFSIPRGGLTALVGESGCGKSMTALSVMGLVPKPGEIAGGEIWYDNPQLGTVNLLNLSQDDLRLIRGNRIAMIFQEPMTSLNPVFTIGSQIAEAVQVHEAVSRREAFNRAIEMLTRVGIPAPEKRVHDYPHSLSGGMRQRVMIAMALVCRPDLLIADEPTTALDVTIQAQILDLIHELMEEFKMSLLLITHDLGIVAEHAQEVLVMYAGQVVEKASVTDLFDNPRHPYTKGLLASVPSLQKDRKLYSIPGAVPALDCLPKGCTFQGRCERVQEDCYLHNPALLGEVHHRVRCFFPYGTGGTILPIDG